MKGIHIRDFVPSLFCCLITASHSLNYFCTTAKQNIPHKKLTMSRIHKSTDNCSANTSMPSRKYTHTTSCHYNQNTVRHPHPHAIFVACSLNLHTTRQYRVSLCRANDIRELTKYVYVGLIQTCMHVGIYPQKWEKFSCWKLYFARYDFIIFLFFNIS